MVLSTEPEGLHILRKPNLKIVLLFFENYSKFKNKLKHASLPMVDVSSYR